MKEKKFDRSKMQFVVIALIVIFCAASFGFEHFGYEIRGALSPRVEVCRIGYIMNVYIVPEETLRYDSEAEQYYIFFAEKTDKYKIRGCEAVRYNCRLVEDESPEIYEFVMNLKDVGEDEKLVMFDAIYLSDTVMSSAILHSDKEIIEGRMVIVE